MNSELLDLNTLILEKTKKKLLNNGFQVEICKNKEDALDKLLKYIDKNDSIGYGGSRTLEEIGFFDKFKKEDFPNIFDRRDPNITLEQKSHIQKKALNSDVFVSSVNALSINGELVLIDKWGNRNGGLTFGPKKRIVIVGINKIVENLENAIHRAKNVASVLNNIRFQTGNPCTKEGKCVDCNSIDRLCSVMTIISRCPSPEIFIVILVNENLGF